VQTPQGPLTVGGLYLPNGNPIAHRQVRLQDRLDGPPRPARRAAAGDRGDVRAGRRLQRLPDRRRRVSARRLRRRRALPAAVAARRCARCSTWA
jgi:hypothetical protein